MDGHTGTKISSVAEEVLGMSKLQDGEEAFPYNKLEGKALYRILDNEEGRPTVVAHVASQLIMMRHIFY